jgi:predicted MFS family arabinose efflux permease
MSIDRYSFLLAIATFAMGTDAFIVAGILPQVADALTVTIGSAGLIVSVFSLSYAVSAPVVSVLTARVARKTILVGALMVFAAANVLSAMSATLPSLLATRVLAALAAGMVTPTCYAIASGLGALSMVVWAICGSGLFTLQQQRAMASNPQHSSFMLALNNSALYFGASLGSAFVGGAISMASLSAGPPVSAGIAIVALMLLLALPQPTSFRQRAPSVPSAG